MQFNLEFIVALVAALYAAYLVHTGSKNISPYISFLLLPLLVAYLVVVIINNIWPGINQFGRDVKHYIDNKTLGEINDMGYIQLFPPIFIVLIIFVLLLYNRTLS